MDPNSICRKTKRLAGKQAELCQLEPEIVQEVAKGTKLGVRECQYQFRFRRWNCTSHSKYFGKILQQGKAASSPAPLLPQKAPRAQLCVCVCARAQRGSLGAPPEVLLPGHVSPCCNEAISDAPRQRGASRSPRMHPRLAVIYCSPRDPAACRGEGAWRGGGPGELPLAPRVPRACRSLVLPLERGGHPDIALHALPTPEGLGGQGVEGMLKVLHCQVPGKVPAQAPVSSATASPWHAPEKSSWRLNCLLLGAASLPARMLR